MTLKTNPLILVGTGDTNIATKDFVNMVDHGYLSITHASGRGNKIDGNFTSAVDVETACVAMMCIKFDDVLETLDESDGGDAPCEALLSSDLSQPDDLTATFYVTLTDDAPEDWELLGPRLVYFYDGVIHNLAVSLDY